ncbi:PREDICTED: 39S ribosomal protein L37, mitochondrial [Vollenhovia emeryi]|uniref:39S ribosomal protein L37, mitochondrial n=1 Tax=Vollenhovia emeryi TaxID=411798 RepID=UPI0005F46A19|nr:PREDICTED: 39S ribosomal protein L37, mitochondrial [Vollenhovia emeryi]XP_011871862.1 PREDICTED: 39S ribosomal protein L37, mitochondrial [Vollenhovia emeryi]
MRLTRILYKQNIGRQIKSVWYVKRERKVKDNKTEQYLSTLGIPVKDAAEVVDQKQELPKLQLEFLKPRQIAFDETHPDWKARACLVFKDHNVLQEGFCQAQVLTNTVCLPDGSLNYIQDSLPDLPEHVDDIVKRIVYSSNIFDAHQEQLPKRKDPKRPAWVFPREYGITNNRKMRNLSRKLLQLCETLSGPDIAQKRCILCDGITKLSLDKESDLFQFTLRSDVTVTSADPLKPIGSSNSAMEIDLPNIHPLHYTIGLDKTNVYRIEDMYPVSSTLPWINVHTIFVHYDPVEVKNLTELAVTQNQVFGRTLLKAYTVTASCARQKFGSSVKELPEPVTVQCIQSDGRDYHFFIFQLNSLDTNDARVKNFWCALPPLTLYDKAEYDNGRPVVEGYNPEVFRRILAFYRNGN